MAEGGGGRSGRGGWKCTFARPRGRGPCCRGSMESNRPKNETRGPRGRMTDRQADGQVDGWTDGWMNGCSEGEEDAVFVRSPETNSGFFIPRLREGAE